MSKKIKPFSIGDRVIEKFAQGKKKRVGEVIFVQEGNCRKLQLIQLNSHNLKPLRKGNLELKVFRLPEDRCKKLNEWKYFRKRTFQVGDTIINKRNGKIRYGRIISFVHPDGLYTESNEKGYNGKDLIECIEIKGCDGLPRNTNSSGEVVRFNITPEHAKVCTILPMDDQGGIRIEGAKTFIR